MGERIGGGRTWNDVREGGTFKGASAGRGNPTSL